MRVLILSLLALVSFSKTDFVNENLRLRKTNTALLNALRSLSQEQEAAVGGLECWDHDGVEEDCPAPCVWRHSSRGYGFCYPSDTAPSNRRTDRVARGCYTLDRANCCKYRDGRMTTDYAESPCVLARTGTFTSGAVCEPRCWADGTCGHSGGGSNVARMGSCGDTETEKAVGAAVKEKAVGVPEDCWYYDGYKEDCPEGCVWTHFSRGDGMCNAPGVAATRTLSEEKAVGAAQTRKERKVGALPEDCWYYDGYEEDCPEGCVWTHFSRGTGMCNAPGVAATRTLSEEKAVGADYSVYAQKTWCRDWDSMSYDSLRTTPTVTYEQCKQKCESIPTCNYFLHGERVMDSKMNRCVTWDRCDMRGGYNDGSPTVYERAKWRSPFAGMDEDTAINFG